MLMQQDSPMEKGEDKIAQELTAEEPCIETVNENFTKDNESEMQKTAVNGTLDDMLAGDNLTEWLDIKNMQNSVEPFGDENGDLLNEAEIAAGDGNHEDSELNEKPADLEEQLADVRDQLLRKTADFENFRKRMNHEKQKAIEFANESLLLDIIPIIDDFERAIQSAETSEELNGLPVGKAMLDGISMIEKRLVSQLESKWGLKRYNSAGEPFDPNIHEAMFVEKSPDVEEPVVQEDFAKGYMLKDRVIRAAKVKVLMPDNTDAGD
jgi:molecular chaperone GrpE